MAKSRGRILALRGIYDYLDQVLPHCYAADKQLLEPDPHRPPADLATYDVVMVGCPATLAVDSWGPALLGLLDAGGVLVTTDWGLHNVVQLVFPGTIARQGSAEGSFPLRVRNPASPLLQGIEGCAGTPWVVESGSDRIGILDPKRVDVVLDAPAMGEPSPVLVTFPVGRGLVVHAISHFHLQGSAESGVYVSAYLLTNIVDEAVRRRHLAPAERRVKVLSGGSGGSGASGDKVSAPPAPGGRVRLLSGPPTGRSQP
jgi:hypothetical protein